jgi:translocation and assembly module TamB
LKPKVDGYFHVGEIEAMGDITPVELKSGDIQLNFAGYEAKLDASVSTTEGQLQITGDADWNDLEQWRTNLAIFADELKVEVPPIVKVTVKPDIKVAIKPGLIKLDGNVDLPWGRILVSQLPESAVSVSSDEVILDENLQPVEASTGIPFDLQSNIKINIGDDFQLAAFGLKGSLVGDLNVTQEKKGPFIIGEINIVDGSYRSFGQDLIIDEGKILFNGPADQPYVSIKAIRNPDNTEDDVVAGIQVTGPADEPEIAIFSDPAMPQANALSYILKGQDIDGESGGDAMTTVLIGISLARSGKVVGEIGEAFGVQDLQLDTAGSGDESQVTVSGYILPGLQVKYGIGIFDSIGEFTLRYRIMKDLYLEAVSGSDNAVDFLYQFQFD